MPGSYDIEQAKLYIVLFLHQTATLLSEVLDHVLLYIVLFLHQTATGAQSNLNKQRLYIVLFLHQTATIFLMSRRYFSYISFYSYIKPQLIPLLHFVCLVVYRSIPTSNRNRGQVEEVFKGLYIVLFLHQTATLRPQSLRCPSLYIVLFLHQTATLPISTRRQASCISFYSYIKPQLRQ